MSKKSATVFAVFIVAIIAFCLANVFAAMTGTYTLNLFNDDNSTELNLTNDTNTSIKVEQSSNSYQDNHVNSEDVYVSDSGQSSDDTGDQSSSSNGVSSGGNGNGQHDSSGGFSASSKDSEETL